MSYEVLCINLLRARERRNFMEIEARRLAIKLGFITAVDGNLVIIDQIYEYSHAERMRWSGEPMTPTEVACFMSHINAWRLAADSISDLVVILEDDVKIDDDFDRVINSLSQLPTEAFDIARLMTLRKRPGKEIATIASSRVLVQPVQGGSGTQGYVISPKVARELLNRVVPFMRLLIPQLIGAGSIS